MVQMGKEMRNLPYKNAMDKNFRRMHYVRYADDFIISVIGSKSDTEKIKGDITKYMHEKLKLELSEEKTLITHGQDKAMFLGYEISIRNSNALKRNKNGVLKRDFNGAVILSMNPTIAQKKLNEYKALEIRNINGKDIWWSVPRRFMTPMKVEEIVAQYSAEIRGFYNYFSLANNVSRVCASFAFIMKMSMLKTLAWKLNTSSREVRERFTVNGEFTVKYKDSEGKERVRVFYNQGFRKRTPQFDTDFDHLPITVYIPYPTLVERLRSGKCELCGKGGEVMMHHVRTLKDLEGKTPWEQIMLKRRRKTLVVCEDCNRMIQGYDK